MTTASTSLRLPDGIKFWIESPVKEVAVRWHESMLDCLPMEVINPEGRERFINPFQVLYIEDREPSAGPTSAKGGGVSHMLFKYEPVVSVAGELTSDDRNMVVAEVDAALAHAAEVIRALLVTRHVYVNGQLLNPGPGDEA